MNSNFKLKDSAFIVGDISVERSSGYEEKVAKENKSLEGLILK